MREWRSFIVEDISDLRERIINYARNFTTCALLDSCNNRIYGKPAFDLLFAGGAARSLEAAPGAGFEQIKQLLDAERDWCFGYFGYDLKNEVESLSSQHPDRTGMPAMRFFVPEILVIVVDGKVEIGVRKNTQHITPEFIFNAIKTSFAIPATENGAVQLRARMDKSYYLEAVEKIREHIMNGDMYEMNFCQEFYADHVQIDPYLLFEKMQQEAKAPFSAFFRCNEQYLISASPERFLRKKGKHILAQPIKGTAPRSTDPAFDRQLRNNLLHSEKDRAENVMIVDLMRNDLSRSAVIGSVQVDELFGIYSFQYVHQMVSSITAVMRDDMHPVDLIRNAFPPGSMTGAPKVRAMQLIEQYETVRRGVYSGAFGYFTPDMDFDFNVVIRSVVYNATESYLSVQVGGAIVYDSVPEQEYAECLLKLEGIKKLLAN